ncbi:protein YLS3 [Selaginella moellendorffii]|nr:protein YLS3 [Selaginella moellendorffii]|eukprot:XP_024538341.1 protein YLS3 [Selaginella moellendorffii]
MASSLLLLAFVVSCGAVAILAAQPDCTNEIEQLQPCLAYVEGQVTAPSSDCCKGLLSVHTNRPVCLCILMSSSTSVNSSTATLLPSICKVDTDPKRCPALLKGDAAAPTGSSSSPSTASGGKAAASDTAANSATPFVSLSSSLLLTVTSLVLAGSMNFL